jgi:hypothetical protein
METPTEVETPVEGLMVHVAVRVSTCIQSLTNSEIGNNYFPSLPLEWQPSEGTPTVVETHVEGRRVDGVDSGDRWEARCIHYRTLSR